MANKLPITTSDPQIEVELDVGTHVIELVVEDSAGNLSEPDTVTVTVVGLPSITGISPHQGLVGSELVVTGKHFTEVQQVRFTPDVQASFTVASSEEIRAMVPEGAGAGPITVVTAYGEDTSGQTFTPLVAPVITQLEPASGPWGASVSISGVNLSGASSVQFAPGLPAAFLEQSDSLLIATVPAGAETGPVTVTTSGGTVQSPQVFSVVMAPVITAIQPTSGAWGTALAISGENFIEVQSVRFAPDVEAQFQVPSEGSITTVVPQGAETGPISVETAHGTDTSPQVFTVIATAPVITGIAPDRGEWGDEVAITGQNFMDVQSVIFGGGIKAEFAADSESRVTALVPQGAETGPIMVVTAGGTATSTQLFTVLAAPLVTTLKPTSGAAGTAVIIGGENFVDVQSVAFAPGVEAEFVATSEVRIDTFVAAGAETGPVTVRTAYGEARSPQAFSVLETAPVITSIEPASGTSGDQVGIAGRNFVDVESVIFGGGIKAEFAVDSETRITATVPQGAQTGEIMVITASGTATSPQVFTVVSAPVIRGFAPTSGLVGTRVTITGLNFIDVRGVSFAGRSIIAPRLVGVPAEFKVISGEEISTVVPDNAASGPITVTTGAGSAASRQDFTLGLTEPTRVPIPEPTLAPTRVPVPQPTLVPTRAPIPSPTGVPTRVPIVEPTLAPTRAPIVEATPVPTRVPIVEGTSVPVVGLPGATAPVAGVSGIGPTYETRLTDAGITTVSDLANADAAKVAEILGVSEVRAMAFIDEAKRLS